MIWPKLRKADGGERRDWLHDRIQCSLCALRKRSGRVLSGRADAATRFDDLCQLLESLGFEKRVRGSHHLFRKSDVEERINLQRTGAHAEPYQVKQVRAVILKAMLGSEP